MPLSMDPANAAGAADRKQPDAARPVIAMVLEERFDVGSATRGLPSIERTTVVDLAPRRAARATSVVARNHATLSCNPPAPVAQRIEHPPPKRGAAGSIPAGRATNFLFVMVDTTWTPKGRGR